MNIKQRVYAFAAVLGLFSGPAQAADTINWLTSVPDGTFSEAANWTGAVIPTNNTIGAFTGNPTYTIRFPAGGYTENSATKVALSTGGSLTFDTRGTWWLKDAPSITNGWPNSWTGFQICNSSGSHLFNIEGLLTTYTATNYPIMCLSNAVYRYTSNPTVTNVLEEGLLNLYDPKGITFSSLSLITGSAGTRHVAIFKTNSTLRATQIRMRGNAYGNYMIFEGGDHTIYGGLQIGEGATGSGFTNTVRISGGTVSIPASTLYIGNGKTGSHADLAITGYGAINVHNEIRMSANASYPTNSSTLALSDHASLITDTYLDAAYSGYAKATISLEGNSRFSIGSNLAIARGNNSLSTLDMRDQSTAFAGGYLLVGGYTGSDGTVTVRDNANMMVGGYVEAGTGGGTGRVELVGGRLIAKNVRGGSGGWSKFVADGGTLCASNISASVNLLVNFGLAELGAAGLTLDSAGYDVTVGQSFTDAAGTDGLFLKTGAGTLSVSNSTHALTAVAQGGLRVLSTAATFGRSLAVTNGASLSMLGSASTLTAGDLTLGTTGDMTILYMDSGDSITVTNATALTINSCGISFGAPSVNGTYTLFRSTGATLASSVLDNLLLLNPVAGKGYAFAIVPDGADSTIQLSISDLAVSDALWDGSESADWNTADNWTPSGVPSSGTRAFFTDTGAEKSVNISAPAACSILTFDSAAPYLIQGSSLAIAAGSISNALGSHTLSMPLTITGDFACQSDLATTTTVSGAISAPTITTVSKVGSGTFAVSGNNTAFNGKWNTSGGRLLFGAPSALGGASAATNAITIGACTMSYAGSPAAVSKGFLLNPGAISNAAIIDAQSDLAVTGPISAQTGIFIKRGAGKLSFDVGNGTFTLSAAGGSGGVNITPTGTIVLPASGDAPDPATGLGGFNLLEGTLRLKGNGASTSIINQRHFGIIGGQYDACLADPVLELDAVQFNQGNSGQHFLIGNQLSAASTATNPTLRLVNGASLSGDTVKLGNNPATAFSPKLIMSNSTLAVSWQVNIGYNNSTYPYVRIAQNSSVNASGGNQYGGGIYAYRNVDVVVSGDSVLGQTGVGGSFRFYDGSANGTMRFENGGKMRFAKFMGLNVSTVNGLNMVFDGGVMEPVASGFSFSTAAAKQSFIIEAGGLTVNTPAGVRHALTFPITGTGALTKTGPGELIFAEGVTYTTASATNSIGLPTTTTGLATGDNTGGTTVQQGILSVSNGTIRADAAVAVIPGAALNLSAGSVTLGEVSGSGTVSNGVLTAGYRCHAAEGTNDTIALTDVTLPTGWTVAFDLADGYALTNRQTLAVATRSGTTDLNLASWHATNVGDKMGASFTLIGDTVYANVYFTGGTLISIR